MHICILTPRYPTTIDPSVLTFVQQLAWTLADLGQKISVICPVAPNRDKKWRNIPDYTTEKSFDGHTINLYFPKFIDCGQTNIAFYNTAGLTTIFFKNAVDKVLSDMPDKPNVLYGHFITPAGVTAALLGQKYGISSFVAYGESTPWSVYQLGKKKTKKYLTGISGIVSVSTANKQELYETGVVDKELIEIFPNGYRRSRFMPRDKQESRRKFGIPEDKFVVAFVGHFIERKGLHKLLGVISRVEDVYLICAGKGKIKPEGEKILYANPVQPDELSYFYSSADVFVLPTQNEGCCNAIIEAMACGLPIVSSNRPFNDDILNESNSIRIDPMNSDEIADAIMKLKNDNKLRIQLAKGSLKMAEKLTLENRAKNILEYIEEKRVK